MQPFYNFKQYLAYQLTKKLGKKVGDNEITYTVFPKATILGTLTKELVADVLYYGEHYYFNYDRSTLVNAFDTVLDTLVGKIPAALTTSNDIVAYIADKTKLDVSGIVVTNPTDTMLIQLDAGGHSVFKGKITLPREGGFNTIPSHFWPLNNTFDDSGRDSFTMAANFDFVDFNDKQWAAIKSGVSWGDTGILLPNNTDFSIQFEVVASLYNGLSTLLTEKIYTTVTYNYNSIYTNYSSGLQRVGLYGSATPGLLPSDTPTIIAVTRSGNVWKLFVDGTLVGTFTNSHVSMGYRWFGSYGERRNRFYIRNYLYWTQALSDADMATNALI